MAKRTLDGQPMPSFIHQIAPEPIPQATASHSATSTDDQPASPQQKAPAPLHARKSFWTQPGITAFVDWITDPDNHARVYKQRSMSGERILDIQARIAEYVNAKCSTTWTWENVKQKVAYAKAQYTRAALLRRKAGETEDDLRAMRLDLCPYFDRFHAVYEASLPKRATTASSRHSLGKRAILESSSSEASDMEDDHPHHDSDDDYPGHMDVKMAERSASRSQSSKDNGHGLLHKRQRQDNRPSLEAMGAIVDNLKRQVTAMETMSGSLRASWEQQHEAMLNHQRLEHEKALKRCVQERETMLQQRVQEGEKLLQLRVQEREKMLQQRVQDRERMLEQLAKELDEVHDRRSRELEVDKEEFKAEREKALQRSIQECETRLQQRVQEGEKTLQLRARDRENMLEHLVKELDEVHDRRRRELEVDKEEFKAERERIMKKLEADRQEFKNEQAEFRRSLLDFTEERVRLAAENARLAALLEVHAGHHNRQQLHTS
ncbi:unnamed protein product [Mortierella alpina]